MKRPVLLKIFVLCFLSLTINQRLFAGIQTATWFKPQALLANHNLTLNYGILTYPILAYDGHKILSPYSSVSYSFSDFLTKSDIQYKREITRNMDFKVDVKNFDNVTLGWEIRR